MQTFIVMGYQGDVTIQFSNVSIEDVEYTVASLEDEGFTVVVMRS